MSERKGLKPADLPEYKKELLKNERLELLQLISNAKGLQEAIAALKKRLEE